MSQAGTVNSSGGGGSNITFVTDSGSATPSASILNVNGAGGATTSGSGNQIVITAPAVAGLLSNDTIITSAQIKAISGNFYSLLPVAAPGQVFIIWYAVVEYLFGTTPYTPHGTNFLMNLTPNLNNTWGSFAQAGMLDQSENAFYMPGASFPFSGNVQGVTQTVWKTYNLYLTSFTGAPTGGDGTLKIRVYYTTLSVPF